MSRAVRPRPVDVYKPLQIHYGFVDDKELRYEDENGFMRTVVQGDSGAHETIHAPKPDEIVVQVASIVEDYETMPHEKYRPGNAFIKQRKVPEDQVEYVCEDDDFEWIDTFNAKNPKDEQVSYDTFELMIDRLERAAMGGTLEMATAEKLGFGKAKIPVSVVQGVYQHWNSKRMKLSNSFAKALLLRYRTLKNPDDPDPNVVFRPREREYHTRKKTRKNDKKSFQKMVELRLNFERTRNILELMKQREKLKQDRIQLMRSAFEVQLQMLQKQAKEDPNAEREVHSQFLQEEPERAPAPPPERTQRMRTPSHHYNAYERNFQTQDRIRRPRPEPVAAPAPELAAPEPIHHSRPQKSAGILKPLKKRVMLAGHSQTERSGTSDPGPRAPPVMRIIRSLTNKDSAPIDIHQVHESGKWVDPMAEGREWSSFRYTSRGRVGRGGRIIFDRTMVGDRIEDEPKCGVEALDFNSISAASLKIWTGETVCGNLLRKRKLDDMDGMDSDSGVLHAASLSAS